MFTGFFSPLVNTHLGDYGLRGMLISSILNIWKGFSNKPLFLSVHSRKSKYLSSASSSVSVATEGWIFSLHLHFPCQASHILLSYSCGNKGNAQQILPSIQPNTSHNVTGIIMISDHTGNHLLVILISFAARFSAV